MSLLIPKTINAATVIHAATKLIVPTIIAAIVGRIQAPYSFGICVVTQLKVSRQTT